MLQRNSFTRSQPWVSKRRNEQPRSGDRIDFLCKPLRIGKILISFQHGAYWILGQSQDGMAHSHQGSIRK